MPRTRSPANDLVYALADFGPILRQTSHTWISYPIHHSRGREHFDANHLLAGEIPEGKIAYFVMDFMETLLTGSRSTDAMQRLNER
jgi:hypothetical protein